MSAGDVCVFGGVCRVRCVPRRIMRENLLADQMTCLYTLDMVDRDARDRLTLALHWLPCVRFRRQMCSECDTHLLGWRVDVHPEYIDRRRSVQRSNAFVSGVVRSTVPVLQNDSIEGL